MEKKENWPKIKAILADALERVPEERETFVNLLQRVADQQGLTRGDINEKTGKIAAKQKEIDADKQAISDAQDDLRQAGGDPGWAR